MECFVEHVRCVLSDEVSAVSESGHATGQSANACAKCLSGTRAFTHALYNIALRQKGLAAPADPPMRVPAL